jgi:helix-turn-helix protein
VDTNDSSQPVHVTVADRFAIVPEALLYDPEISADAVRVYGVLARHGSDPSNCYPKHARIAALIGRSKASVWRWIKELEGAGWIDVVARVSSDGDPDSNGYVVHATVAAPRGVPATPRGGVPADPRGGSPRDSSYKESKGTTPTSNDLFATPVAGERAGLALVPTTEVAVIADLDPLYGFDHFWDAWPRRGGKRLYRGRAEDQWKRLDLDERKAAWRGAINYATASANGTQGAMDAFRWLRDRSWVDWQEPPSAPAKPGTSSASISAAADRIRNGNSSLFGALK